MVAVVVCFVRDINREGIQFESMNNNFRHFLQIENSDVVNNRLIRKLKSVKMTSLKNKLSYS